MKRTPPLLWSILAIACHHAPLPASAPRAAEAASPRLVAAPLQGPFESIEALCSTLEIEGEAECTTDTEADHPAPFDRARVVRRSDDHITTCALAVRSRSAWYALALGECWMEGSGDEGAEVQRLGSEQGRLVLQMAHRSLHALEGGHESVVMHICGAGESGAPSCATITTQRTEYRAVDSSEEAAAWAESSGEALAQSATYGAELALESPNVLHVERVTGSADLVERPLAAGRVALVFP